MSLEDTERPILFFDGVCNLCNKSVQFVIKHDKRGRFMFAPLQSKQGQQAIEAVKKIKGEAPDSVILFHKGMYFTGSDAALHTFKELSSAWRALYLFIAVPRFIRNWVYNMISRNRYKWFGKRDSCMMPTPKLRSRFLS